MTLVSALLNTWESVCVTPGIMERLCTSHLYSTVQLWDAYLGLWKGLNIHLWKKRYFWGKKALGGLFCISGIFLLPRPTQHKATALPSGGSLCQTSDKKQTSHPWAFQLHPETPVFVWFVPFLLGSAPGHISGCQCLRVQRHSADGAPAGEGGEDPCSGSWHDQVGTEIPGGKCDETVCFGCSCNCGCSEVNGTFHRAGIIFFFQLNVIFPTQECCHAILLWLLILWSEQLLRALQASGAWLLFLGAVQLPAIRNVFPGEDSSTCRIHFPN